MGRNSEALAGLRLRHVPGHIRTGEQDLKLTRMRSETKLSEAKPVCFAHGTCIRSFRCAGRCNLALVPVEHLKSEYLLSLYLPEPTTPDGSELGIITGPHVVSAPIHGGTYLVTVLNVRGDPPCDEESWRSRIRLSTQ